MLLGHTKTTTTTKKVARIRQILNTELDKDNQVSYSFFFFLPYNKGHSMPFTEQHEIIRLLKPG